MYFETTNYDNYIKTIPVDKDQEMKLKKFQEHLFAKANQMSTQELLDRISDIIKQPVSNSSSSTNLSGGNSSSNGNNNINNRIENALNEVNNNDTENQNLNRQILLTENDIELSKVEVVKNALLNRNSEVSIMAINVKFTERNATDLINGYDIVVDAVDSWETKLIIAEACQKSRTSLLHIGVDGEKGQCCLFVDKSLSKIANKEILSAPKDGVMGPMVGLVSSMASILLIDYLTGNSENNDKLFYYDYKSSHIGKVLI